MSSSHTLFVQAILFVCVSVCFCLGGGDFLDKMGVITFFENCCPQNFYLRMPNMFYEAPGNLCQF